MKKYTTVLTVVGLTLALGAMSGCSSGQVSEEQSEAYAGASASDLPVADPASATVPDSSLVADASQSAAQTSDADPAHVQTSPVNLGASSAGRSH